MPVHLKSVLKWNLANSCLPMTSHLIEKSSKKFAVPQFNIKMSSYQYRKSHYGDKMILRPSYLHNGISYTGKTRSLCQHLCSALCSSISEVINWACTAWPNKVFFMTWGPTNTNAIRSALDIMQDHLISGTIISIQERWHPVLKLSQHP